MINALSPGVEPREVILDVFGFSRGAAASRYFVNCFRQGFVRYWVNYVLPRYAYLPEGRNVRFRFDGIFDTVAAIGRGTNDRHGDVNVDLSAAQADQIYHLTAQHEYRENFRLNHNILGGGYRDQGDETRVAPSETHVFFDLPSAETAHRAHRTAAAAGVPFNAFPTGGQYAVPPRLAALWGPTMRADALPRAENQRTVLREFGDVSANLSRIGMGPELGRNRLWQREIYPNEASKAK